MANAGIVRNRLKIAAAISNAQAYRAVVKEFGSFDRYIWQFAPARSKKTPSKAPESPENNHANARIGRHEQRPEAPRLSLRRHHDLLRVHASGRHGKRSRPRLFSPPPDSTLTPLRGCDFSTRFRVPDPSVLRVGLRVFLAAAFALVVILRPYARSADG